MAEKIRWGILGTGNIARQFCTGVNVSHRSLLAAVGSRSPDSARDFAQAYRIAACHDYEALIADPNVDAVYNALPNSLHHEWTIKSLQAGKHVLCEKPLAMDQRQSRQMFATAEKNGRILMEAFMYRSHPLTLAVQEAVGGGAIGELRFLRSSFCYSTRRIDGNVRFVQELGGGSLMDVGCYCINLARMLAGQEPAAVHAVGRMHPTGVDEMVAGTLSFATGFISSFTCAMTVHANNTAFLCGTEGYIEVPVPWKPPPRRAVFVITRGIPPRMDAGGPPAAPPREERYVDAGADLYAVEADDFAATVLDGKPPTITAQDSIGNMQVLDEMRRQLASNGRKPSGRE